MRFLMVDGITRLTAGHSVEGYKCWSMSDEVFRDHFPGTPIVPGVLLVESMAQMVGFLIEKSYLEKFGTDRFVSPLLSIIHKAKFRRFVQPGECVQMTGTLNSLESNWASARVESQVKGQLKAEAELSFVISTMDPETLDPELKMQRTSYERFVFRNLSSPESSEP